MSSGDQVQEQLFSCQEFILEKEFICPDCAWDVRGDLCVQEDGGHSGLCEMCKNECYVCHTYDYTYPSKWSMYVFGKSKF